MNRLNIITLGTKDIVRAHEFYKKVGFVTSVRGPKQQIGVATVGTLLT